MNGSTKRGAKKPPTPVAPAKPIPADPAARPRARAGAAAPAAAIPDEPARVYARRPATSKERIIARWRGVDLRSVEIAASATDRPAGNVVLGVLKKLRLDQRQAETEIVKVWNHLIDSNLTAHAQPAGIHKGTLFVNVDSSVWLDEIVRYRRKDILTRLQTAFGSELIKRISFRVG